jgi:aryl-alcohol dehydrogenase-like predicted oxidoreductase
MGRHEWGDTSERALIDAVHAALEGGVNLFDTADIYGLGTSEKILGRALGDERRQAVVATKFGVRRSEAGKSWYDNSASWIQTALDRSLERLGTDYIDLYQLHYWDEVTPLDEIFESLEKARANGKIRYYGVSNIDLAEKGFSAPPEGLVSFSYEYSLANRGFESRIDRMIKDLQLGFMSWGSLGQGILCGKYDESTTFTKEDRRSSTRYVNFHGEALQRNLGIVELMKEIVKTHEHKTLSQIAIRWILDRVRDGVVLAGVKRPRQIQDNIGAVGWSLGAAEMQLLDEVSRITRA